MESEADESGSDNDVPRLQVTASRFQELLRPSVEIASDAKKDENTHENRSNKN